MPTPSGTSPPAGRTHCLAQTEPSCFLRFRELDDHLDIVSVSLEGTFEVLRPLSSGDQPAQPGTVCPGQLFAGPIPVPLVGVDAADDDVVLQHCGSGDITGGRGSAAVTAADASKTDDASVRDFLYTVGDDRTGPGAFDDDVWLESDGGDGTAW